MQARSLSIAALMHLRIGLDRRRRLFKQVTGFPSVSDEGQVSKWEFRASGVSL
jgi:hypothetical protein